MHKGALPLAEGYQEAKKLVCDKGWERHRLPHVALLVDHPGAQACTQSVTFPHMICLSVAPILASGGSKRKDVLARYSLFSCTHVFWERDELKGAKDAKPPANGRVIYLGCAARFPLTFRNFSFIYDLLPQRACSQNQKT